MVFNIDDNKKCFSSTESLLTLKTCEMAYHSALPSLHFKYIL